MQFAVRYAISLCAVAVFGTSCTRQKIELEEAPPGQVSPQSETPSSTGPQLPAVKAPRTEEDRFNSLQVDGKNFDFFELAIPPSFLLQPDEYRFFSFLNWFSLAWEQASYRSPEERDAAFFFHSILLALLSGEEVPENRFRDLANYALPLYLYKRIPPHHKPAMAPEELENLAQTLWEHGFNLNHVRQEDLRAYLRSLREVAWKDRVFSPEDPWQMIALREEGMQLGREDLAAVRRCASIARGNGTTCPFGRYQLRWKLSLDGAFHLILSATLETGRGRDVLQSMLASYQKRPGWFSAGMQFPTPIPQDEFILAATGPLPLVLAPATPPGDADLPQNMRQSDWENTAKQWMDLLGNKAPEPAVRTCFPGILDALSGFLRYTHSMQGKPSERLTSNHLAPSISDSAIMERLWSYVWFAHAAATGHHTSLGIRSGCEGQVLTFLSLRLAWRIAAADESIPPDAEILALRLFFGLLHHFHTANRGEENAAAAGKTTEVSILSSGDFPELVQATKLISSMEAAWVLVSQPENFLLTMAPRLLSEGQLLPQRAQIRENIGQFKTYRVYLPALLRVSDNRVSYRRMRDAMDYYLQLTSEARRVKLN